MASIQNDTFTNSDKPENHELNSDESARDKTILSDNKEESITLQSTSNVNIEDTINSNKDIINEEIKKSENNNNQETKNSIDGAILNITDKKENSEQLLKNAKDVEILEEKDIKQNLSEEKRHSSLQNESSQQNSNHNHVPQQPKAPTPPPKSSPQPSSQTNSQNSEKISFYNVKWIEYKHKSLPIVTQNENGPCPLLAIINFLFLQQKISLSPSKNIVESPELTSLLANYILEHVFSRVEPGVRENLEQQVNDAISMIPSLVTGLDVNIRFTGISDFEYTSDIEIFNLLGIPLYHGWLVDPELVAVREVIMDNSYNQLVVKIVHQQSSENENLLREALIAEEFLNSTASQLTYHGLCELSSALNNQDMGVLFRNNHFLTIFKHSNSLYVLATDQGFLNESGVVWESLSNIEGDSHFCDSNFKVFRPQSDTIQTKNQNLTLSNSNEQINNDYLMALTLQQDEGTSSPQTSSLTDEELARSLQLEEQQLRATEAARTGVKTTDVAETAKQKKAKPEASTANQATSSAANSPSSSSSSVIKVVKDSCIVM